MKPTEVFNTYWQFAAERQALYLRRLTGGEGPWTDDPVLRTYRFTNAYRASDRVSQFLISEVQYSEHRSQAPAELFYRTMLFKIFNRIDTWSLLERKLGPLSWQATPPAMIAKVMDEAFGSGQRLYSAAYIMPSPSLGHKRKHENHLALIGRMMDDGLPGQIASARSLDDVFELLLSYPGIGRFLAFQYAIDLNYSALLDFSEEEFVVAGPGAIDGISKCFSDLGGAGPEEVILWVTENQDREFSRRGIEFPGLFGRPLMPIDCQNLFCEISKYARVTHPDIKGVSGRTRIKQSYRPSPNPMPRPRFPSRWGLNVPEDLTMPRDLVAMMEDAC